MLTFVLIAGLGLLAAAVTLLARGLTSSSGRSAETRDRIGTYGFAGGRPRSSDRALIRRENVRRAIDQLATVLGDVIAPRFSLLSERAIRERLVGAGMYATPARKIVGYQILLAFAGCFVWVWLAELRRVETGLVVLGVLVIAIVGWLVPVGLVDSRARKRREAVERGLPDMIDLLVVTLEAGLSLPQALRLASSKLRGPIAQELRLTLQEQNMGLTLSESLANFQKRMDTPAVRLFARSVAQGEQLGVPTAQLMRTLAEEMRKRRRSYAEEKAQKAPVKMLFPLVFLIYPAIFVVLMLPAILNLKEIF